MRIGPVDPKAEGLGSVLWRGYPSTLEKGALTIDNMAGMGIIGVLQGVCESGQLTGGRAGSGTIS